MQSFNSFLLFPNGVGVEQTLGGMFRRAGGAMTQDNDIDMIRFQNLSGVLQSLAFAQARSGGRNVDHVRAQPKSSQLERSASACTRFDKKINERLPAQRRYLFDFARPYLLEGISGFEGEIDFIDRQLAQPEQIFAVPAGCHENLRRVPHMLRVARASRVLVSASRRNNLPIKVRETEMVSPTR